MTALPAVARQAAPPPTRSQELIRTVVIDAGHGGKDPGSVHPSGRYYEKDIVLAVALKFGALIEAQYPQVRVVYTRKTDIFVPVDQRGKIANDAEADLFFSIHTNSNAGKPGTGTETLIMGLSKSTQALEAAMRENDVVSLEADYSTKYQGYEPGSAESLIIFNLMQFSYREQSLQLAQCIQNSYRRGFTLVDRGVKESPVWVLWAPAMPSILTELGFINNPSDLRQLISDQGQEQYARTLLAAFTEYKTRTESRGGGPVVQPPAAETENRKPKPTLAAGAEPSSLGYALQGGGREAQRSQTAPASGEAENRDRSLFPAASAAAAVSVSHSPFSEIFFSVQVGAFPNAVGVNHARWGAYRGRVFERRIEPYYKYFVDRCATYAEASRLQDELVRTLGECFVVAFDGARPIPVAEARKRTQQ